MAMPMLSGPGSIGVVMGLAANAGSMVTYLGMVIGITALSLSLLRNRSCRRCQGNKLESEGSRFGAEFGFLTFVKTELSSGKVTVVEFLAGGHEVEDGAG